MKPRHGKTAAGAPEVTLSGVDITDDFLKQARIEAITKREPHFTENPMFGPPGNEATRKAQLIADWWGEHLLLTEKRAAFIAALQRRVAEVLSKPPPPESNMRPSYWAELFVDYDPDPLLREALAEIGVECRGAFSAKGVFDCTKTGIMVELDGRVMSKVGYGQKWVELK